MKVLAYLGGMLLWLPLAASALTGAEVAAKAREQFAAHQNPIVSVDTKKKEMVGNFKNNGVSWEKEPCRVKDHDFRSDAKGMAIPYGIFDTQANRGFVVIGTSYETPALAVDAIILWWKSCGRALYSRADQLLILTSDP